MARLSPETIEWWTTKSVNEKPIETFDPTVCDTESVNDYVAASEVKE